MYRCFSLPACLLDLFKPLASYTSVPFKLCSESQLKHKVRTIVPRPYSPVLIAPGSHLTIIGKLHITNGLNDVQQKRSPVGSAFPLTGVHTADAEPRPRGSFDI